jgi:hypothetical protein
MNNLVEARVYDRDIFKSMFDNIKNDILLLKKRNFDKDLALRKDRVKLKSLKN